MPTPPLVCEPSIHEIRIELERIRDELDIPSSFPDEVLAEAVSSASTGPRLPPGAVSTPIRDRTDLHLVTIDPPGSLDLDQAVGGEATAEGWRVFYAISDVAAWVSPTGAIDRESQERGLTMYSPDSRSPLHPVELSEGAASLLPGVERQALLWTIDLDAEGRGQPVEHVQVDRAGLADRVRACARARRARPHRFGLVVDDHGPAVDGCGCDEPDRIR